jgi:hypothetical protein
MIEINMKINKQTQRALTRKINDEWKNLNSSCKNPLDNNE